VSAARRRSKRRGGGQGPGQGPVGPQQPGGATNGSPGGTPAKAARAAVEELWRVTPEPPEPLRVRPATDPGALLRSLGSPPLTGQGAAGDHYLAAVVERSAGLATALAAAADLLADPDDEG
jgi:hypothetical protein